MKERISYPDICKFLAIFLVTWSHCSQCISGQTWCNFLGGKGFDIAFNMPFFMLMSGWFINPDKIRKTSSIDFIKSKFMRLVVPALVWYVVYCLFTLQIPHLKSAFTFYWFLNCLFVCLCIIYFFVKFIKYTWLCILLSTIFVILTPYTDFLKINFMLPYLWAGYLLRKLFVSERASYSVIAFTIAGCVLAPFWNIDFTVYQSPFNIIYISEKMLISYIYRFSFGFCLSAVAIYLIIKLENMPILNKLAKYGKYTLTIYTSSFVINGMFSRVLNFVNFHTNDYILIDLTSLLLCSFIIVITIHFCNVCQRYTWLKKLFLGD